MDDSLKVIEHIKENRKLLNREEWLEKRREVFTGTEASILVGANPYVTPYQLYHQKQTGEQQKENFSMLRGKYLEPLIADLFQKDKEYQVFDLGEEDKYGLIVHPSFPLIAGTPDRLFIDDQGQVGLLEIKTAVGYGVQKWATGIPDYVMVQLQHYLMILEPIIRQVSPKQADGLYGIIAYALDDKLEYSDPIPPNKEIQEMILEAITKYEMTVKIKGEYPSLETVEDIMLRYREQRTNEYKEATEEDIEKIKMIIELQKQKDASYQEYVTQISKTIDELKAELVERIGDDEGLLYNGEVIATRKTDKKGTRRLNIIRSNINNLDKE